MTPATILADAILIGSTILIAAYTYRDGVHHGDWQDLEIRRRLHAIRRKRP